MKLVVVEGSMRENRNTSKLVNEVLDGVARRLPSIETQILRTATMNLEGCRVTCSGFCTTHPYQCAVDDDAVEVLEAMRAADGVLLATPLYFRAPPARFHTLMERLISVHYYYESQGAEPFCVPPLSGKRCGLISVSEYSDPQFILEYLTGVCHLLAMEPIRLSRFPYLGVGGQGDVSDDPVFRPLRACHEMAERLASALAG